MPLEKIYVLHKHGAKGHYVGLECLAKEHNLSIEYYEFSILSTLLKSAIKLDLRTFRKQVDNIAFFRSLKKSKNKKIILGIAPYDYKLVSLLPYLEKHHIYYHTSWTCWDKSFYPNHKKNTDLLFEQWRNFLEFKVRHIFAVTTKTKKELNGNYSIDDTKISVVYHALKSAFHLHEAEERKEHSFIYVGRLLQQKGIEELVSFFERRTEASLTIIGDGKLSELVKEKAVKHSNIHFITPIYDADELAKLYRRHQYVVLNSKRTAKWEELFGIILIEGMSQGTIPIASNHPGPKEIITGDNGFLFPEGELHATLNKILKNNTSIHSMSQQALASSAQFHQKNIAQRWKKILVKK
ncbi:hypothetical protein GCM10009117_13850 [Gangjinia marincola]|uniref:Glycosyl transferase family 1 domain-containing protein n=1 Tax=Gangjinia marincola TaxID=578463 RepID=A0ABP3XV51_9FLAO